MTLKFGFYNSVGEDRLYDATDFSEFFDGIIGDGVLQGVGEAFKVTPSGISVIVGTGRAWFNKTWTYNDDQLVVDLPSGSTVNNRIDTLVLQVDKRLEGRENTILFVVGTPSSAPVAPTLAPPTDVYQYPIADVYRPRDASTTAAQHITSRVGTSACPFASNTLINIDTWDLLAYKRSVVRGNNLGATITNEQKQAIRDGSFEGLYLGDYWRKDNINWRIVDFDYWMNQEASTSPYKRVTRHHLVIVPDDTRIAFGAFRPFTSTRTAANGGWDFSTNGKSRLSSIATKAKTLFGTGGLLDRTFRLTTSFSVPRHAMNQKPYTMQATPLTEMQIYGARNFGLPQTTTDFGQFALYKHNHRYLWIGHDRGEVTVPSGESLYGATWLHDQYYTDLWCCAHDSYITATSPSVSTNNYHQVRPAIGVTGY